MRRRRGDKAEAPQRAADARARDRDTQRHHSRHVGTAAPRWSSSQPFPRRRPPRVLEAQRPRDERQLCLAESAVCCCVVFLLFVARSLTQIMSTATIGANHRLQAFGMSLAAGCATGIGASFVLCTSSLDRKLLAYDVLLRPE